LTNNSIDAPSQPMSTKYRDQYPISVRHWSRWLTHTHRGREVQVVRPLWVPGVQGIAT